MQEPSIGVIVPNYNDTRHLPRCLRSVLEQPDGPQELIIMDDHSTDGSVALIRSLIDGDTRAQLVLNPVNLGIMAAIAFGGTMVQWLFSSEEGAKSLDDAIGELEGSVKALGERGKIDIAGLKEDFGTVTPEVLRLNEQITALADVAAINDLRAAIGGLKAETEGSWWGLNPFSNESLKDVNQAAGLLGVDAQQLDPDSSNGIAAVIDNPVITEFQQTLDALGAARGPAEQLTCHEGRNRPWRYRLEDVAVSAAP